MKRKKITMWHVTHVVQNTQHIQEAMRDWVRYILEQIQMLNIPFENVANFDETNLDFSVDGGSMLNSKGAKTVPVKGGQSSDRATAFIGVSMTGECFTPYIIYKGMDKSTGRVWREFNSPKFLYPKEMLYAVQPNAWMDKTRMLDWVERVWKPWAATKEGTTYLLMDEFSAHMTDKVKTAIYACDTEIDFIIGGYTSKLQAMDVGLNASFKGEYRQQFEQFMVTSVMGKPHWQDVAKWAWNAWQTIHTSMILNTWRRVLAWGDEEVPVEQVESDNEEDEEGNNEIIFMDTAT
jgi:hypothetical protein